MKQIIIKRMTLSDWIVTYFGRLKYGFRARFHKNKLRNHSPVNKEGYVLTFEDDFDAVSWSRKQAEPRLWGIGEHWGSFHPKNGRSWWTEPIFNGDSTISCVTRKQPKEFYRKEEGGYWYSNCNNFDPVETLIVPYSVGGLSTGHRNTENQTIFKQQYGRWECRCRVPAIQGVRSAYWMWGSTWTPVIYVFEIDGRKDHANQKINLHFGMNENVDHDGKYEHRQLGSTLGAKRREGKWQEFVLEWTPKHIKMITDGVTIFRCSNKEILKWYNDDIAQMWVLIYQAVIGDDVGEPDENGIISSFDIDYVRVYEKE